MLIHSFFGRHFEETLPHKAFEVVRILQGQPASLDVQ